MLANFRKRFTDLETPPQDAEKTWYRRRGKEFENIICSLLEDEGLQPRTSYRPTGEEIDGSFLLDNRLFLLEAKWHKDQLPASSIYQFKGKVDGKLIGTIGVFISMSGYSDDAIEAVRLGKTLNVILFDGEDFRACLDKNVGFSRVLHTKLRFAAEAGDIYIPYKSEAILGDPKNDIIFIVEGHTDQVVISHLASKVLEEKGLKRNIDFIVAMGKIGVANIANSAHLWGSMNTRVVLVADSDGDVANTRNLLTSRLEYPETEILVIHPSVEAWLYPGSRDPIKRLQEFMKAEGFSRKELAINKQLMEVNIEELKTKDEAFRELIDLITK